MQTKNSFYHLKYRPDIDGLRTIAVLLVIIFHAYPKLLPSGFIGVDIFFVISGFLITSIVFNEIMSNTFSIIVFYKKRIRRIFPALLTVLTFALISGFFILPNQEFKQLGKHIISGIAFISNITLFKESGYFDTASETKPLLHLWSLGVEEQFYFIFPLILILVLRKKINTVISMVFLFLISLTICIFSTKIFSSSFGFFMLPSRFWEILSGSILAITYQHTSLLNKKVRLEFIPYIALFILGFSLIKLNPTTPFPSYWAILPVAFTILIICSEGSKFNSWILSSRIFVYFGKISYPLYLWHWPLLVFSNRLKIPQYFAIVLSILLSILTYALIEKPIQKTFKSLTLSSLLKKKLFFGGALISALLIISGFLIKKEFLYSFQDYQYPELKLLAKYTDYDLKPTRIGKCFLDANLAFSKFDQSCFQSNKQKKIFILGDSHAAHLYQALPEVISDDTIFIGQLNMSGCPPFFDIEKPLDESCINANKQIKNIIAKKGIDKIILFANWTQRSKEIPSWKLNLQNTVDFLKGQSVSKIILVGPFPILDQKLVDIESESITNGKGFQNTYTTSLYKYIESLDDEMLSLARTNGLTYISIFKLFCSDEKCQSKVNESDLLTYDAGHLTKNASRSILTKYKDDISFFE